MKILSVVINIVVGVVFSISAFLKLFPVEYFEIKISQFVFADTLIPSVLARVIIGFEFFIGFLLITQIHFNKFILKLTLLSLIGFILINGMDIWLNGVNGNCGCFGMESSVTPVQSIIKNILLLALTILSLRHTSFQLAQPNKYVGLLIFSAWMAAVFVYRPVYVSALNTSELKGKKLDLGIINGHPGLKGKTFTDDLTQGKRIVVFISLTCNYCKLAGYKLSHIKKQHPELPVYFILNGDSTHMDAYYEASNARNIPAMHFNGSGDYLKLSGPELPAVFLIENGIIYRKFNFMSISGKEMLEWYAEK